MEDKEEGEETTSRGNEWEVVSINASAYAASLGPGEVIRKEDGRGYTYDGEAETSQGLFMSRHFVFPPSQHENLPVESDSEIHIDHIVQDLGSESDLEGDDGVSSGKHEVESHFKGSNVPDDFPGVPLFDERGNLLSVWGTAAGEVATLQELNRDKEQIMHNAAKFSSFQKEALYGENMTSSEIIEPSDMSESLELTEDGKYDKPDLPCAAWWKRGATSLYSHAKEANTLWSIFVAASVMGLVILGQQWQKERWQVLQLKWQSSISDEKMSRILGPILRFKDVIVSSHHRGYFVRESAGREK